MTTPDARILAAQLASLTVLRPLLEEGALNALYPYIEALCAGETAVSQYRYHELYAEMLKTPRLTGEVLRDCFIHSIITVPTEFTRACARGADDTVVNAAMERDLSLVQRFCAFGGKGLGEIAAAAKPTPASDKIVRMAGAAWGGTPVEYGGAKTAAAAFAVLPQPQWQYENCEAGFVGYSAQDAINELLDAFEREEDWARLRRPLQKFFARYGEVERFKYPHSFFDGEELLPVEPAGWPAWNEFVGIEEAQNALLERAEEFLSGNMAQNLLIHGEAGLGKTSLVYALAELASIRLIITPAGNWSRMRGLLSEMRRAPMKFIVLIDDVRGEPGGALNAYARFAQSPNIWFIATSREAGALPFADSLGLESPPLKAFIQRVIALARERGAELDYDTVQDVCIDWKVDGGDLTASAALRVLAKLTE